MMGSAGSIAALVNLAPKVHVKCYNLWREKKWDEAMKIQEVLSHADWEIGRNGGTTVLKGIVSREYGYGSGALRGPLSQKNVDGELDKWVKRLIDMETEITL
jgi:4-hydroxy-2-oxoglutarate aldolase